MAKLGIATKRLLIDQANARVTAIVAASSIIIIFSIVMGRSLIIKQSYQSKVIKGKSQTLDRLNKNIEAVDTLKVSYAEFIGRSKNIIDGASSGTGERDGDNAKLTLDALPSKYDFPALATSIEKLLTARNFTIDSISGVDDEIAQQDNNGPDPKPVEMPFKVAFSGTFDPTIDLLQYFERSIRPIQIQTITFKAESTGTRTEINAITFYLPEKNLNITTEVVK